MLARNGLHDLRGYLESPAFLRDNTEGKGVNVYGPADTRTDALSLIAKMFVFGSGSVYYTTTHSLIDVLENKGQLRATLGRIEHLFVDWFERDFRTQDRPYGYYQLISLEEFLHQRKQAGYVTSFGSYCRWEEHKWFSRDFLAAFCDNVIDIKVGK